MSKRALILGVAGQDGSYLAELLLQKGYTVHGLIRRSSVDNLWRIRHLLDRVTLHKGDLADPMSVDQVMVQSQPHEVYNLADQDQVNYSESSPAYSFDITAAAVGRTLESIRIVCGRECRFFQPSSLLVFGSVDTPDIPSPQDENTPFRPRSPYALAKVAAMEVCRYYRDVHKMHVSIGIMGNHDSERRSEEYLLHKICAGAVRIAAGKQDKLALGNLDLQVDIGYAPDYMDAAWRMLQQDQPGEYVIGSGDVWTVGQIVEMAFLKAETSRWERVTRDLAFWTPGPHAVLTGNLGKAKRELGWTPATPMTEIIKRLVAHARKKEGL